MLARLILVATVAALVGGAALAQASAPQGERLHGTVKSLSDGHVLLATAQGDVDVTLTSQTRVLSGEPAKADEIKPGAYLGTSNQTGPDGATGTAAEVHLMANGPNVHNAMNNTGMMMTNGHVKSVAATAKGLEMDVDYGAATTRHVVVPKEAAMTHLRDVGAAGLKPGQGVNAMVVGAGAARTANFIVIDPPKAQ